MNNAEGEAAHKAGVRRMGRGVFLGGGGLNKGEKRK